MNNIHPQGNTFLLYRQSKGSMSLERESPGAKQNTVEMRSRIPVGPGLPEA